MSFGWKPPFQKAGGPIVARELNRAFEAIGGLMRMTVGSGLLLEWVRGAPLISLAGDFALYDVILTSAWTARAGEQFGVGKFKFRQVTPTGLGSDAGLPEFDGYNFTAGEPVSGMRGIVARVGGTWRLIAAECPPPPTP